MKIFRGTTPTFIFTFKTVSPSDMDSAFLVVKQFGGKVKISKDLSEATVQQDSLEWTITQEESLRLTAGKPAEIHCDWVSNDGTRGHSEFALCDVIPGGKDEVI